MKDHATRYVWYLPLKRDDAPSVARALVLQIFLRFGIPDTILSDRGTHFLNELLASIATVLGFQHDFSSSYHPQTNGMVERQHLSLGDMMSIYQPDAHNDWNEQVPFFACAYNSTVHEATGHAPFTLMFGRDFRLPLDIQLGLPTGRTDAELNVGARLQIAWDLAQAATLQAQERSARYYNTGRNQVLFEPGQRVLLRQAPADKAAAGKINPDVWQGPFMVHTRLSPVSYVISRNRRGTGNKETVHIDRLKPYFTNEDV